MFIIREADVQTKKLTAIYRTIKYMPPDSLVQIQYYKSIFEINILFNSNITLSEFKSTINKLNQQCSTKVISIFKLLYPSNHSIKIQHSQFAELVKIFKNIKINILNESLTDYDRSKFQELTDLIKPGSYFIYKHLKIHKAKYQIHKITLKHALHYSFANISIHISEEDSAILYLKLCDPEFNNIINKCKINTLKIL